MFNLRKIQDIKNELKGVRVLCRVDFNVPVKESGIVLSDFRIKAALPTIELLQKAGAKVILISHIGREKEESLRPVANYLKQNMGLKIEFLPGLFGQDIEDHIDHMQNGDIVLLENLRSDEGETENTPLFVRHLAEYGEVYVNDAFSVSHREHASVVGLSSVLPAFAGLRLQEEVAHLNLSEKKHPILAILGGKKLETKEPLIRRFLDDVDSLFICGVLAHEFFISKGFEVGNSLHEDGVPEDLLHQEKIHLPVDVLVENGARNEIKTTSEVLKNETIVDLGSRSLENLKDLSSKAETIIWNGPFGWYEKGYDKATQDYLTFLASVDADVIIGGGDTVGLIEKMNLVDAFAFVSTGGGAMLEFLEKGTLVGLKNLEQ